MTYYEWVNYFENLKDAPINDNAISIIENSNIDYKGNIKIRYLNHIVDLINYRLNNSLDNFLMKCKRLAQDKNTLSLELNDLKKEIVYARKLASIKYFEETVLLPFEFFESPVPRDYVALLDLEYGDWHKFVRGAAGGCMHLGMHYDTERSYKEFL